MKRILKRKNIWICSSCGGEVRYGDEYILSAPQIDCPHCGEKLDADEKK